jgi:HEAT repeat protein
MHRDTCRMMAFAPMMLLALAASAAGAQQSRTRPTPPTPPTAPTPATLPTLPTPATAPTPPIASMPLFPPGAWAEDVERALRDARRAMEEARTYNLIAPRALMETEMAAARAGLDEARIATTISGEAAAIARQAAEEAMAFGLPGQYAIASTASASSGFRTQPRAAWDSQDMADSLYREARRALGNDNYPIAAMIFKRIRDEYPKSTYTPDSYYWEAFAMHRIAQKGTGSERASLSGALEVLSLQQQRFPRASTRGDANSLRTRIEGQLARLGDLQAIASLADRARNATSDGCPRPQDDERIDALNAVAQMDAEQALPILKRVLARREPCTQQLRRTAVWLVASRRPADAASILLDVAKTDPDKEVREQAVFWMSNVPTDEATSMLIELVKKGDDLDLQKKAVYSLSRSKSPRAATTLREVALDPNADVSLRGEALNWYMSGPGKTSDDAFAFLKDVYGRADDPQFKRRVLQTIMMRRNEESRAFLVEVAQNSRESMEIRRSAVSALSGSGVTNAQLAQIYDRTTEVEVRKQLISVLSSLRDNGGLDKLLDIARNEKNVELRKQAVSSLSRSKDPRAVQLLTEIINR